MKSKIAKDSSLHLYLQLADILRSQIAKLAVGHRFYADREICRLFKVSQPTARMALSILVKEGLIERVPSRGTFVREGYKDRKKSMSIGVISPLEPYRPHALGVRGIENLASEYGYCTIFSDYGLGGRASARGEDEKLSGLVEKLKKRNVDGIIIISPIKKEEYKAPLCLQNLNIPLVLINWSLAKPPLSMVIADYEEGARRLVLHLADLGYRTIGFIGGAGKRKANLDRFQGYRKALIERGIRYKPQFVCPENPDFDKASGYEAMNNILSLKKLPRAIFAVSDRLALGVMEAIKSRGLNIPEDVAVAGFDAEPAGHHIKPRLTSVTQPYYELGTNAMRLLREKIEGRHKGAIKIMVPCELVLRESCGYREPSVPPASGREDYQPLLIEGAHCQSRSGREGR